MTVNDETPAQTSLSETPGNTRWHRLFGTWKGVVVLYLVFLGVYLAVAGPRLRHPSRYNHFVYLAMGWLDGKLELAHNPPNENDWAKVDVLRLRDGTQVKGMFDQRGNLDRFRLLDGSHQTITPDQIVSRHAIRYVSFPPLPAVLMLPLAAIWGLQTNDVLFNAVWAAVNPVLLFLLLGTLRQRGHSQRSVIDDLWLVAMFGVGSVYFYCSVVGQVWYTAHVVGVTAVLAYAWASLDARHPYLAGLFLGLGFATRTPLGFMFPLFILESVRVQGGFRTLWQQRRLPRELLFGLGKFAVPAAVILAVLLMHNQARFHQFTEFGHRYLNILWQDRIQRWGLFNYHFLSRNLAVALVLLPRILAKAPYLQVSQHGLSVFVTTPVLAFLFPGRKTVSNPLAPALWLTVLATALPSLMYQNSGFVQFGYRFSLDYMVFLTMLLACNGRPQGRLFRVLVLLSIPLNLFGAITFDRFHGHTYSDAFFPHGANN